MSTKTWKIVALILGVALVLGAIGLLTGVLGGRAAAPADVTLTEANANSTVQVQVGQTVRIDLAAQPSTGYSWSVGATEPSVLQQAGDPEFRQPNPATPIAGGVERQVTSFKVVGKGACDLTLNDVRPWDKGSAPVQTFTIHISAS